MKNEILKNEIAPWQETGKWYHGEFDCSTKTFIAEKTDDFLLSCNIQTADGVIIIYNGINDLFVDAKVYFKEKYTVATSSNYIPGLRIYATDTNVLGFRFMSNAITSGIATCWFYVVNIE